VALVVFYMLWPLGPQMALKIAKISYSFTTDHQFDAQEALKINSTDVHIFLFWVFLAQTDASTHYMHLP